MPLPVRYALVLVVGAEWHRAQVAGKVLLVIGVLLVVLQDGIGTEGE